MLAVTPISVLVFMDSFSVKPVPIAIAQKMYEGEGSAIEEKEDQPSDDFLKGYNDGWKGKWLGPIRWTMSEDYRQGHMLGAYDQKKQKARYDITE